MKILKVFYPEKTKKLKFKDETTYQEFLALLGINNEKNKVKYKDHDGDFIDIENESDYEEFLNLNKSAITVHVSENTQMKKMTTQNLLKIFCKIFNEDPLVLEVPSNYNLSQLEKEILSKDESKKYYCHFFDDRMPLFDENTKLNEYGIKDGSNIFILKMPISLKEKRYTLQKGVSETLSFSEYWKCHSEVSEQSLSVFLCTLRGLGVQFLTKMGRSGLPHFFKIIRETSDFLPVVLSVHNFFLSNLFNFEKYLICCSFFSLFRKLLPEQIKDKDVFMHSSELWVYLLHQIDMSSVESDEFTEYYLYSDKSKKLYNKPCRIEGSKPIDKIWEYDEISKLSKTKQLEKTKRNFNDEEILIDYHLKSLIQVLKNTHQENLLYNFTTWHGNYNIFKTTFRKRFTSTEHAKYIDLLTKQNLYKYLCFVKGDQIGKLGHVMSFDKDGKCVYIYGASKGSQSFNVESPSSMNSVLSNFLDNNEFDKLKVPISIAKEDVRQIEQINLILFDISYSMKSVSNFNSKEMTRLEAAKTLFLSFMDKYISHDFPHSMGLMFFGEKLKYHEINRNIEKIQEIFGSFTTLEEYTALYHSIDEGINKILIYVKENKHFLKKNVLCRIIVFTDGEDNLVYDKKVTPESICKRLVQNNITLDTIVVGESYDKKIKALSYCSQGFTYILKDIVEGTKFFESEAVLSLHQREPVIIDKDPFKNCDEVTPVESLKIKVPEKVSQRALGNETANVSVNSRSSSSVKRVYLEFKKCHKANPLFEVFMSENDFGFWKVIYSGETGTPYNGCFWLMYINFPSNFPLDPPIVRFVDKIYHCNVNDDGKVCHEILQSKWSPYISITDVLNEIGLMMKEPNYEDALDTVKASIYKSDKQQYLKNLDIWKKKFSFSSKEEIKKKYLLE